MSEPEDKSGLKKEIEQGNFQRAVLLAASCGLPEEEIRDLQREAVWQIAAKNRNAVGTKRLAQEYGLTKPELRAFLESNAQKVRSQGEDKILKACYDYSAGSYLTFEAWVDHFFKSWNKLPG